MAILSCSNNLSLIVPANQARRGLEQLKVLYEGTTGISIDKTLFVSSIFPFNIYDQFYETALQSKTKVTV